MECIRMSGRFRRFGSMFAIAASLLHATGPARADTSDQATVLFSFPRGAPLTTKVTIDGLAVEIKEGSSVRVDPGHHFVTIHWRGFPDQVLEIDVRAGEQRVVTVSPYERNPGVRRSRIGWTLAGIGAAGFVSAIVTGVMVDSSHDDYVRHCPNRSCDQTGRDAASSGRNLVIANTISWGVAIAGTAVATWLLWPRSRHHESTGIAISPTPDGCWFAVRGAF